MLLLAAQSHWVLDLGGRIERDSAGAIAGVILRGTWVTDSDLEALRQMKEIARLDLALTRITDQGCCASEIYATSPISICPTPSRSQTRAHPL